MYVERIKYVKFNNNFNNNNFINNYIKPSNCSRGIFYFIYNNGNNSIYNNVNIMFNSLDNRFILNKEKTMELTQEQIDNLYNVFTELANIVKDIWNQIKEAFMKFINSIDFNKIKQLNKYSSIYMRTHNQRIKKKQLRKISKLLE